MRSKSFQKTVLLVLGSLSTADLEPHRPFWVWVLYLNLRSSCLEYVLHSDWEKRPADSPWIYVISSISTQQIAGVKEDFRLSGRFEARCSDQDCGVFSSFIPTLRSAVHI